MAINKLAQIAIIMMPDGELEDLYDAVLQERSRRLQAAVVREKYTLQGRKS